MTALGPVEFLENLVRIRSESGYEREASEFAVAQMNALGYREAYVDEAGSAVGVWGRRGGSPRLILLGHIDTVPGDIPVRVDGGELHGRGSVDAKGPLATFIQSCSTLPRALAAEIVVIGAVEEEAPTSKGARQALRDWAAPDFCVIGEPSGTNGVTLGYKGSLRLEATFEQSSTHTAHAGVSIAETAIGAFMKIRDWIDGQNQGRAGAFETIDLHLREFNTQSDGLLDSAAVVMGLRLGPDFDPDSVENSIIDLLARFASTDGVHHSIASSGHERPIRVDRRNPLASAFFASIRAEGFEPRTVVKTGTSDMNVVGPLWNCPICAFGPGDSSLDHTPGERISIEEYESAIRILSRVLARLSS